MDRSGGAKALGLIHAEGTKMRSLRLCETNLASPVKPGYRAAIPGKSPALPPSPFHRFNSSPEVDRRCSHDIRLPSPRTHYQSTMSAP